MARSALGLCVVLSVLATGGCDSPVSDDDGVSQFVNADGELIPPDDGKGDTIFPSVEQALINRDNGVVNNTQLSYRSAMKLANQVGVPCDDSVVTMTAIARAESSFRVTVVGPQNDDGSRDYGVWQINSIHGYPIAKLKTPLYNAQKMADLSNNGQDKNPWAAYTSGRYSGYMRYARTTFDTYACK